MEGVKITQNSVHVVCTRPFMLCENYATSLDDHGYLWPTNWNVKIHGGPKSCPEANKNPPFKRVKVVGQ